MAQVQRLCLTVLILFSFSMNASAQDTDFGTSDSAKAALIGILYDLKQTQQGEESGEDDKSYVNVIGEFLNSGWDEGVLNRFFRVSRPVYSTQIFIRTISAGQAPKAFGVDDVVEPRMWLVHYKGQIVAPMDGIYRLAGFADDFMAARINEETVLVCGRPDCIPKDVSWESSVPDGLNIGNGAIRYGDWFAAKKDEVLDLDVLLGERPGGIFSAWLYIERKGETYTQRNGKDLLPVFQLSKTTPPRSDAASAPPRESSVWEAVQ